jgi:hypothetical protein
MCRRNDSTGFVHVGELLAQRFARVASAEHEVRPKSLRPTTVPSPSTKRRGSGVEKGLPFRTDNGFQNIRSDPFGTLEMGVQGEGPPARVDNIESVAHHLACALRDDRSLAFFKIVAAVVPREVIRDALTRALDVPAPAVRRSRGAIFTALIRPYLGQRSRSGRTPP